MKRVTLLGVCLVVLSGLGATAVSAASAAEPAFYECIKVKGGKFGAYCKAESAKGNSELVEGIGKGKAIKGKGSALNPFVPAQNGGEMTCKSTKLVATLATPTKLKGIVITQKGCIGGVGATKCTSAGQKSGTVVSNSLEGTLGYISAAEHRVGLDIQAEGGGEMEAFFCQGLSFQISGSVIAEVTPVNSVVKTYTLTLTRDSEGFQSITKLEGEPEDVPLISIGGSGPFPGSLASTLTYNGEKLELKA